VSFAPGSMLWLFVHELRLDWRRRTQRRAGRRPAFWVTASLPVFLMLAVGLPLGSALRGFVVPMGPVSALMACAGVAGYFTLMLSQTLAAAVEALYERGDLDLLFASPIAPGRVVMVRFLAIAFSAFSVFGYFTAAPLVVIALMGHLAWLSAIGVIFALALAATGIGLVLATGLLHLLGAKRTRTTAHLLAALIGALFFLLTQVRNILGGVRTHDLFADAVRFAHGPGFHPPPGLDWPLRAMLGEPLPLLAMVGTGLGVFLLATLWLGPRFAADVAKAAGGGAYPRRKAASQRKFVTGPFPATLRKELLLIARDPTLLAQVLVRVLYLLPLGFIALRNSAGHDGLALAGAAAGLAFMANQVAGSLAWITISAEDAPDVLASAPAAASTFRRAKVVAVALAVGGLLLPVLAPLVILAPRAGVAATLGCTAATLSAAFVNLWWQRPAKRADFRNRNGSWFVTVIELGLGLLIGGATGLFAAGKIWGLVPAVLAAASLLALRRDERQIAMRIREAVSG